MRVQNPGRHPRCTAGGADHAPPGGAPEHHTPQGLIRGQGQRASGHGDLLWGGAVRPHRAAGALHVSMSTRTALGDGSLFAGVVDVCGGVWSG